jgi:glycerol-1-phosphate dehydrogenase [NAD(P)+]
MIWNLPRTEILPWLELDEPRQVALFTSTPAWRAVERWLRLDVVWQAEVTEASEAAWQPLLATLRGEVVYAVGGGLVVDAAKYCAAHLGLPLVCLPTALSVDAFLTSASGVRQDGCVRYLETKVAERLVLDWQVIANAPTHLRAAGICDVLSIATGCWDWQFAHQRGMNPPGMEYLPYAAQTAQAILQGALDCAEAAGRGDSQGLKQLFDCLALEVQLTNQLGHARPEEGSEHYFCYAAENFTSATAQHTALPHADLLAPGILLMAEAQRQETAPLEKALRAAGVRLEAVSEEVAQATLRELPVYCKQHRLPYGIAYELKA